MLELSKEIVVAEIDVKVREVGKDVDEVLTKAGKRVIGAGSMTLGLGVLYNASKDKDPTNAIIKGIIGVVLEGAGLYLALS